MKILFASSEVAPYAKTGGLADVSGALPSALASLGHKVMVVMPLYQMVRKGPFSLKSLEKELALPFQDKTSSERPFFLEQEPNLTVYFIPRDEFFGRSQLYGTPQGDFPDNAERFIFFCRGVIHLCQSLGFKPDILHCNDWATALIPVYLKTLYRNDEFFRSTQTVLTIHNLAYQGIFPRKYLELSGLPQDLFSIRGLEFFGQINFLKGGIYFSSLITTVSEKYAQEIMTPEFGCGLDGVLRDREGDVFGVLNAADYKEWNPETDPHIASRYSAKDLAGKQMCKEELMEIFRLKGCPETPILGLVTRLAGQKGLDILLESLDEILGLDIFLALLGRGDEKYEREFEELGRKHLGQLGVRIAFDNALAHKIEAGSDLFLMPSRYEPCGLNQMYSLKYGTIPVVRATGGLDDTVKEFDPAAKKGNGFKFTEYSSQALLASLKRALNVYQDKKLWKRLVQNAMKEDFSWKKSARRYERLYRMALAK